MSTDFERREREATLESLRDELGSRVATTACMRRNTVQVREILSARQAFMENRVVIRLFWGCAAQGLRVVVLVREAHLDPAELHLATPELNLDAARAAQHDLIREFVAQCARGERDTSDFRPCSFEVIHMRLQKRAASTALFTKDSGFVLEASFVADPCEHSSHKSNMDCTHGYWTEVWSNAATGLLSALRVWLHAAMMFLYPRYVNRLAYAFVCRSSARCHDGIHTKHGKSRKASTLVNSHQAFPKRNSRL
jgi:hypothetical protein